MRKRDWLLIAGCVVAAFVGGVCVTLLPLKVQATNRDRAEWVEKCLKDFESIKVGMTRGEIEAKWPWDTGLQGVSPVRFTHPDFGYFKVDVEFDFKRNPADQNRAVWNKDDKATSISKPYIERSFGD